jgi:hypothetical protein
MAEKPNAIITAVHYTPGGRIETVRLFERRGATYSDRIHLKREALVEFLKGHKKVFVGQRQVFMASTFDLGKEVKFITPDIITTDTNAQQDTLEDTPIF